MTKKLKNIFIFAFMIISICVFACGVYVYANNNAQWSEISIGEYNLGNEFSVPTRTVTVAGKEYNADSVITLPDGTATSTDYIVLENPGTYTITYSAEINGVPYVKKEVINVNYNAYSYSDKNTTVSILKQGDYKYAPTTEGLFMGIQAGDVVNAMQMIDVPMVDEDVALAKFFIAPQVQGNVEFRRLYVRFTDVYDSSSYLEMAITGNWHESLDGFAFGGSYVTAGGAGQTLKAVDEAGKVSTIAGGYGRYCFGGFYGVDYQKNPIDPSTYANTIYFNPATCVISLRDIQGIKPIIDTNNVAHYATEHWNGFTSGKVRMSVYAENYLGVSANVIFMDVKDTDLTTEFMNDTQGPDIFVDSDYGIQEMPEARVGENSYYKIPNATAIDVYSGACEVKTYVYFNYPSENAYLKQIKDGKFLVDEVGQYAIVYKAYDRSGNLSELVVPVHAGANIDDIVIELPEDKITTAFAGEKIVLTMPNYYGGSGNTTVKAKASFNEKEYEFDMTMSEWSFRADEIGEWKITYEVTDYTYYTHEESYMLSVTASDKSIIKDVPVFPVVYLSEFEYKLPIIEVYDSTGDDVIVGKSYVMVTDANGTVKYAPGDSFKPIVEEQGDLIKLEYKYDCANGQTTDVYTVEIPVSKAFVESYGDKVFTSANLFYEEGKTFSFTPTIKGSEVVVTNEDQSWTGDSIWTFANTLVANGFAFNFTTLAEYAKYGAIVFKFVDVGNPDICVSARLSQSDNGKYLVACGGSSNVVNADYAEDNSFTIKLNDNILNVNEVALSIKTTDNGQEFKGFNSGKIFFSFGLENAKVGAQYIIYSLCGHVFGNLAEDVYTPVISVLGAYGGTINCYEEYTINPATAVDVVSPNVYLGLTVVSPTGKIVKDVNGLSLDNVDGTLSYKILVNECGEYEVIYTAYELYEELGLNAGFYNEEEFKYSLYSDDNQKPTIDFDGNILTEVNVGTVVKIPEYSVTDNVSVPEKISVRIFISDPYGLVHYMTDNQFKCTIVGEYQLRIIAVDEVGNTNMQTIIITVNK